MINIKIDNAKLQKELAEAQATLEKKPNRWREYEKVGRILHWMKNPNAREHVLNAAKLRLDTFRPDRTQSWEFMAIANYYRLADESEIAQNYFLRAYEMLRQEAGSTDDPTQLEFTRMHLLILVCFALKRFEETAEYGTILREHDPNFNPSLLAPNVALLAEAKLTNNIVQAERAIDSIASLIRASRIKIQTSGDITPWDAYELGLEILEEIETATNI